MLVALVWLGLGATAGLAQQAAPAPAAPAPAAAPAGAAPAAAPAAPKVDTGDTAWVLTSSALVLMMTAPGLALFYGGMVRRKNVLATLMQSFILMAVISVQWVLYGYSLAFGPDLGGIVGSLRWIGLSVGRRGAERGLRGHDPAPGLHGLPAHVRDHHARAHHRARSPSG